MITEIRPFMGICIVLGLVLGPFMGEHKQPPRPRADTPREEPMLFWYEEYSGADHFSGDGE